MGKYSAYVLPPSDQKKKEAHPIWRGIGFILAFAVPIFSYIAALEIFQQNQTQHWFPIPNDLIVPWGSDPYLAIKIFIAIVLIVVIFAVLSLVTFMVNSAFGAPRYGPLDSPPLRPEDKPRYTKR